MKVREIFFSSQRPPYFIGSAIIQSEVDALELAICVSEQITPCNFFMATQDIWSTATNDWSIKPLEEKKK